MLPSHQLHADMTPGMASADTGSSSTEAAHLERQIRAVRTCLDQLGPWCAAAAAYLDLLAPLKGGDATLLPAEGSGGVGAEGASAPDAGDGATLSGMM